MAVAAFHPLVPTLAFSRLLWSWGNHSHPANLHKREMEALEVVDKCKLVLVRRISEKVEVDTLSETQCRSQYLDVNICKCEGAQHCWWFWCSSTTGCYTLALPARCLDQEVLLPTFLETRLQGSSNNVKKGSFFGSRCFPSKKGDT